MASYYMTPDGLWRTIIGPGHARLWPLGESALPANDGRFRCCAAQRQINYENRIPQIS